MKQAKDALKKNNEDFAKLYITSASQKRTEGTNIEILSIKLSKDSDKDVVNVRPNKNNEK